MEVSPLLILYMKGDNISMAQLKDLIVSGVTRCLGKLYASELVGKLTGTADRAIAYAWFRAAADKGHYEAKCAHLELF